MVERVTEAPRRRDRQRRQGDEREIIDMEQDQPGAREDRDRAVQASLDEQQVPRGYQKQRVEDRVPTQRRAPYHRRGGARDEDRSQAQLATPHGRARLRGEDGGGCGVKAPEGKRCRRPRSQRGMDPGHNQIAERRMKVAGVGSCDDLRDAAVLGEKAQRPRLVVEECPVPDTDRRDGPQDQKDCRSGDSALGKTCAPYVRRRRLHRCAGSRGRAHPAAGAGEVLSLCSRR